MSFKDEDSFEYDQQKHESSLNVAYDRLFQADVNIHNPDIYEGKLYFSKIFALSSWD